jgi:hypothetical protein
MAGAKLSGLAGAAGNHILMAFPTTLAVVGRSQSQLNSRDLFEDEAIVIVGTLPDDVFFG